MSTIVDRLHDDFGALAQLLDREAEPSLRSTADDCFRKALLLAAASHFEAAIMDVILAFVSSRSPGSNLITEFVRQKALTRQYHTMFDWDKNNANKFYSLFGKNFKEHMERELKRDPELEDAVKAFLEVGRERNRLVHQDFGNFALEKTAAEIFSLFTSAMRFPRDLPRLLAECPMEADNPSL